jgi:hypothetical protein
MIEVENDRGGASAREAVGDVVNPGSEAGVEALAPAVQTEIQKTLQDRDQVLMDHWQEALS